MPTCYAPASHLPPLPTLPFPPPPSLLATPTFFLPLLRLFFHILYILPFTHTLPAHFLFLLSFLLPALRYRLCALPLTTSSTLCTCLLTACARLARTLPLPALLWPHPPGWQQAGVGGIRQAGQAVGQEKEGGRQTTDGRREDAHLPLRQISTFFSACLACLPHPAFCSKQPCMPIMLLLSLL